MKSSAFSSYEDTVRRRREHFGETIQTLTEAALETVIDIVIDEAFPNLIVEQDHEGGAILVIFDEFGRTEWLIEPDGSDLLFSRTRRPRQKFPTW